MRKICVLIGCSVLLGVFSGCTDSSKTPQQKQVYVSESKSSYTEKAEWQPKNRK